MNSYLKTRTAGVLFLVFAAGLWAVAQAPPDRAGKPAAAREEKPETGAIPSSTLDRTTVLPPADPGRDRALSALDHIHVQRILVEGSSVLTEGELSAIVGPYEGRDVRIDELQALRRELSEEYVRRGYVNSGVVIPDQEVVDGVVTMREVAGKITKIEINGNGHLRQGYIRSRIEAAAKQPLQVLGVQKALELLQQDRLIKKINARLLPGLRPGEAELDISLKRTLPFQVEVGADNRRSASMGGEQATLVVSHTNLLGLGDSLSADLGWSEGRVNGTLEYSVPVTARDTRIQATFSMDDGKIIEKPFDKIDIRSKTKRGALFVTHPWIRDPMHSLVSSIGIEKKQSRSTLLGIPFSFSAGDREGKSDTTVVNASVEWTARSRNQIVALRGTVRRGVDLFNATLNKDGPDGTFTIFLGQFQYARNLGRLHSELLTRGMIQLAANPLLGLEKIPMGGFSTVRGYREYQFVRDNGAAATLELRVPVRPGKEDKNWLNPWNLRIAPFADYGRSWDKKSVNSTPGFVQIYSAGVGLLWNPISGFHAEVYWAHPFVDVANPGNNLQDKGWHFATSYRIPF